MWTDEDCHQDVTIAIAGVSTNGHHSAGPEMVEYHHHVSNVRRWVDAEMQTHYTQHVARAASRSQPNLD